VVPAILDTGTSTNYLPHDVDVEAIEYLAACKSIQDKLRQKGSCKIPEATDIGCQAIRGIFEHVIRRCREEFMEPENRPKDYKQNYAEPLKEAEAQSYIHRHRRLYDGKDPLCVLALPSGTDMFVVRSPVGCAGVKLDNTGTPCHRSVRCDQR